jgi:hypothetical protein
MEHKHDPTSFYKNLLNEVQIRIYIDIRLSESERMLIRRYISEELADVPTNIFTVGEPEALLRSFFSFSRVDKILLVFFIKNFEDSWSHVTQEAFNAAKNVIVQATHFFKPIGSVSAGSKAIKNEKFVLTLKFPEKPKRASLFSCFEECRSDSPEDLKFFHPFKRTLFKALEDVTKPKSDKNFPIATKSDYSKLQSSNERNHENSSQESIIFKPHEFLTEKPKLKNIQESLQDQGLQIEGNLATQIGPQKFFSLENPQMDSNPLFTGSVSSFSLREDIHMVPSECKASQKSSKFTPEEDEKDDEEVMTNCQPVIKFLLLVDEPGIIEIVRELEKDFKETETITWRSWNTRSQEDKEEFLCKAARLIVVWRLGKGTKRFEKAKIELENLAEKERVYALNFLKEKEMKVIWVQRVFRDQEEETARDVQKNHIKIEEKIDTKMLLEALRL